MFSPSTVFKGAEILAVRVVNFGLSGTAKSRLLTFPAGTRDGDECVLNSHVRSKS